MTGYTKNIETEVFTQAKEQYEEIITRLISDDMRAQEHGVVERYLKKQGDELLRRMLQGYLDIRSRDEMKHKSVTGQDGIARSHRRSNCLRQLSTIFGQVKLSRTGYSKPGVSHKYPLDAALNLPPDKYSHGLRLVVGQSAAKESFDGVVESVKQHTSGKVPKRQAEQLVKKVSQDFDAFYDRKREQSANDGDLLVLTTDAKGIVVRQEDLRESTRRAAEKAQHKKKTRLSRGEKSNRKRMAQVASVYEVEPHKRTAEEIMDSSDVSRSRRKKRPRPTNKRVWASIEKGSGEVITQMFEEASRRDPEKRRKWVVLVDGNQDQIRHIEAAAKALNASIVMVMDFIHALEYLWKAAYALFGEDSPDAEHWVQRSAIKLLNSKASRVSADMRSRATKQDLADEQRKPVDKCASYLLNNKHRLDYKTALENGWPIATGIIEGACRHLIKDRMDITGARWSLVGAESVLRLRALHSSGDFDRYMKFHNQQEQKRNYNFTDFGIKMTA